jgi:hypothetical protein
MHELKDFFGIKVSVATLFNSLRLLSNYFGDQLEEIKEENRWLCSFISEKVALFRIDERRSKDVIKDALGDYKGIVITDFYPSFDRMDYRQQKCTVHLLREMSELAENGDRWMIRMHRKLKRLIKDAIRFNEKKHSKEEIQKAKKRFERRLSKIANGRYRNKDRRRIAKRLRKHIGNIYISGRRS